MSDIRAVMTQIQTIEAALAITAPLALSVKRAYKFIPHQSSALPDLPCFMNDFTHIGTVVMESGRELQYRVGVTFAAGEATLEDDYSADIAAAFWQQALDIFGTKVDLGNTVTMALLRGDDPTLAIIERGGYAYVGWNAFLDISIVEAFAWGGS